MERLMNSKDFQNAQVQSSIQKAEILRIPKAKSNSFEN